MKILLVSFLSLFCLLRASLCAAQSNEPYSPVSSRPIIERDISSQTSGPQPYSKQSHTPSPDQVQIEEVPDDLVETSPKRGWNDFPETGETETRGPFWKAALLWLPNRFLDFIDIFRVDAGVGPGVGAVVRITKFGQFGYREMRPWSLRVGDFGRTYPFLIEKSDEMGFSPWYEPSRDRKVGNFEIGVGADLFVGGAYVGFRLDELADFFCGIIGFDLSNDDLEMD